MTWIAVHTIAQLVKNCKANKNKLPNSPGLSPASTDTRANILPLRLAVVSSEAKEEVRILR